MSVPQRLRRNLGRYLGERLDAPRVLAEIVALAGRHGWEVESLPNAATDRLLAVTRRAPGGGPHPRVYLSAGIHGDEPAGPLALRQLWEDNTWPAADFWICPCLNPEGFARNTRENAAGLDLNRDYRRHESEEIRAHVRWLARQPTFDLALCLHEDWEAHGFYVYELNPERQPPLAPALIAAVEPACPIDRSPEIDGRPARGGIIEPLLQPAELPLWPESIYLISHHTRHSCTLEAPSDFALEIRVAAHLAAVRAAFARLPGA